MYQELVLQPLTTVRGSRTPTYARDTIQLERELWVPTHGSSQALVTVDIYALVDCNLEILGFNSRSDAFVSYKTYTPTGASQRDTIASLSSKWPEGNSMRLVDYICWRLTRINTGVTPTYYTASFSANVVLK